MTNPTLERAARAAAAVDDVHSNWDELSEHTRADYVAMARAVLMAVREPHIAMNAWIDCDLSEDVHPHKVFIAMIDAILNDGEGE